MGERRDPTTDQQLPTGAGDLVAEKLKELIDQRTALGIKKYGTPLRVHNGRDAIRDALEESVDLNQYLMQALIEAQQRAGELELLLYHAYGDANSCLEAEHHEVEVWMAEAKPIHEKLHAALGGRHGKQTGGQERGGD